ncbi:MAG: GNAT family N-acetyltransferase [Thaumarchaeota archaeon]|nr:GNAT family N-acetyltransferase [Nitrososphaerota archaeon]
MRLQYLYLDELKEIPGLDFTEYDGSDPLEIHAFYYNDLRLYQESKLSTARFVKYKDEIVGYFTVSMNAIELDKLGKDEKVKGATPKKYPAMLIGRMGVDKKYRGRGIGSEILLFCRGLAIETSHEIACRYVILHTTEARAHFYRRSGFVRSGNPPRKGIVSMYARAA